MSAASGRTARCTVDELGQKTGVAPERLASMLDARERMRAAVVQPDLADQLCQDSANFENRILWKDALRSLGKPYGQVLWLRFFAGLTQAEIKSIFAAYNWEFNDLDFSLTVRLLEDVLHFDPEDKWYKIKNKAVHAYLRQFQKPWDPMPAAEYMLSEKALRPHAFQAAVMDAEVADLVSILKRSGITDIRKSIRILVTWNLTEKAEDLLIALAREDLLLNIQALPAPDTYDMGADSMERCNGFIFLTNLSREAHQQLPR